MGAEAPTKHNLRWPVVSLAEIATKIGSGATPKGGADAYLPSRARFALVRSQNVFDRRFDHDGLAFISDEQVGGLRGVVLQPDDILLNITALSEVELAGACHRCGCRLNTDERERLFAAYRRTAFHVRAPSGSLTLRIGQTHASLDDLLAAHWARSWAYLTACNPGSVRLTDEENARRQSALANAVSRFGLPAFEGEGVGDDGRWPPEPSLLVVGITKEAALDFGRRFGQAAIVFGERGGTAELLDCSPSSDEHHSCDGRDVES